MLIFKIKIRFIDRKQVESLTIIYFHASIRKTNLKR